MNTTMVESVMPIDSSPDPAVVSQVAVILRHLITAASTFGLLHGTYSDSTIMIVASGLVLVGNAAYALYDLYKKKRIDHAGSVLSARLGRPVTVASS
jgi:hypothetical protein